MIKHIILWKLKSEYDDIRKEEIKAEIKEGLEGLKDKVPGIVDIRVNIDSLSKSTCDLMLDSSFTDWDSYLAYCTHPAHVAVANGCVRPNVEQRMCLNYEE